MFFETRELMLEGLRKMGSQCCGYDFEGAWPKNRCDCKYGADDFKGSSGAQTGCPELRSLYEILAAMSEEDWDQLILGVGGVCVGHLAAAQRSASAN